LKPKNRARDRAAKKDTWMIVSRRRIFLNFFLIFCLGSVGLTARAATPGVKLTATNVSMGDRATGTSQFTLTSVNGFTGQVGVVCVGPVPGPYNEVLPDCSHPAQVITVPANGSVSGTMQFIPPWTIPTAKLRDLPGRPRRGPLGTPVAAGGLFTACLLGLSLRRGWGQRLSVMGLAAAGLVGLGSVSGCIGQGGLAMTPGSYPYVLIGQTPSLPTTPYAVITVTVHD